MSLDSQLREQIDACRPGSTDLALAELAELAAAVRDRAVAAELARSERFDRKVTSALYDLPVPAGLAERILAAAEAAKTAPAVTELPQPVHRAWPRRRLILAVGSLAAAVLLAVSLLTLVPWQPHRVTQEDLSLAVAQWLDERAVPDAAWQTSKPVPTHWRIPAAITVRKPNRWRFFTVTGRSWSGEGVAMHLAAVGRPRAQLFIVSSKARFQVGERPTTIVLSGVGTRLRAVAWQPSRTNLLYVLVVEEDRGQMLEHILSKQPTA